VLGVLSHRVPRPRRRCDLTFTHKPYLQPGSQPPLSPRGPPRPTAVMEAMDTIWNRSTCAAPSTTPSRDAQTLVAPHTATTFSTRPIMDPTSRVNSHASAGSNVYPPSTLER
jgi:hypothetical protein